MYPCHCKAKLAHMVWDNMFLSCWQEMRGSKNQTVELDKKLESTWV